MYRYKGSETITPGAPPVPYAPWGDRKTKPISENLGPFEPDKCGTTAGFSQHRRHGQEQCTRCIKANNEYQRESRAKKKSAETRDGAT